MSLRSTANALARRYPGAQVTINRMEHEEGPHGYKGWYVEFAAADPQVLIKHGLATATEFETRDFAYDEFGHSRHGHGVIDDSGLHAVSMHVPDQDHAACDRHEKRAISKKMQRQVAGLLKRAFALPVRSAQS